MSGKQRPAEVGRDSLETATALSGVPGALVAATGSVVLAITASSVTIPEVVVALFRALLTF
jgi:hypothetical protein